MGCSKEKSYQTANRSLPVLKTMLLFTEPICEKRNVISLALDALQSIPGFFIGSKN